MTFELQEPPVLQANMEEGDNIVAAMLWEDWALPVRVTHVVRADNKLLI